MNFYLTRLNLYDKKVLKLQVLLKIFSYLSHREICQYATVCKKWNMVAQDTKLWRFVSLRPEISGLHIDRADTLTNQIMPTKFAGGNLRYLELPAELITPQVKFSIVFWRWLLHPFNEVSVMCVNRMMTTLYLFRFFKIQPNVVPISHTFYWTFPKQIN